MTQAAARASDITVLLAAQHGIATREQLADLGVAAATIRANVAAGRWQAVSRRVLALHNGPLTSDQSAWFAVLDGGPDCALAGLSALRAQGLHGFAVDRHQTVVPVAARPGRHELYVRRRSRRLCDDAVHPVRQPAMLRVPYALVDALEVMELPLRGCALMAAVVQQQMLRPSQLHALVAAEPTLPNRRVYAAVAADIEGGAQSLLEIDFGRLAKRAGLPPPRRQSVRRDKYGRRRYLDVDFDAFTVEVDGAVHLKPLNWWDDMFRQNGLVISGRPMLRFASVGIRLQPAKVIEQLADAGRRWL